MDGVGGGGGGAATQQGMAPQPHHKKKKMGWDGATLLLWCPPWGAQPSGLLSKARWLWP